VGRKADDASKDAMKIAKTAFAIERGFLGRMARYLYSSGGPGRKGTSSGHILRGEYSMDSGFYRPSNANSS
jgi:hypothetical protein